MRGSGGLGWGGIVRLGVVQMALGAVVVLATSTTNRVMVVELGLPAIVPGALVAWHYALQVLRPGFGHGSDRGGRRTPWIVGGMAALAAGGVGTAMAVAVMPASLLGGLLLAVVAFTLVGAGVGAAGTSLLLLLARAVAPRRRPAAASIVWIMMIAGFVLTAGVAGRLLDPFSPSRLVAVSAVIAVLAFAAACLALRGIEAAASGTSLPAPAVSIRAALGEVWAERQSRRFATFVFLSMLAYGAQELLLEPLAGSVFALTPGASAALAGVQHAGVLAGMLLVGASATALGGTPRLWTTGGCVASAIAAAALAYVALADVPGALRPVAFLAGAANGAFSIAAIGAMMGMADRGEPGRAGVRMGLWGAAQAVAFALGGMLGTGASDLARAAAAAPGGGYAAVLAGVAALFLLAAAQAVQAFDNFQTQRRARPGLPAGIAAAGIGRR